MIRHDVVVVGAGASGAPLAARLSEDGDRRVLLVEAGPVPLRAAGFGPGLLDGRLVPGAWPGHPAGTEYPAHLTPERPYTVVRGRFLGGSTTINGGYFVRARRADFDRWAAAGNDAWSFDRVLPFLRGLETDLDHGSSAVHGGSGPVRVRRTSLGHPAAAAFGAAAAELGFPAEPDKNDQGAPGFGPVPTNTDAGVRVNTGLSYLLDAFARPNLAVSGDSTVLRVLVEGGGTAGARAVGVELERAGRRETVRAGEVVLCAGAFASPQLLLLSGIGPRADLERLGVPVVRHAPGVGAGFGDHPQVVVEWAPSSELPAPEGNWLGGSLHLSSSDGGHSGDLEILQSLVPMAGLVGGTTAVPGAPLPFLVSVQAPESVGKLRLVSADPGVPPRIDYGYLSTADSRRRMREAVRVTAAVIASRAFGAVAAGRAGPDPRILADDGALDRWIAGRLGTSVHACASAPMGPPDDPGAVVDQYGRVYGVSGLRVADTSILPTAPLRGPAATAVLVGEVVAAAMRRPDSP
ncbi:glucose-methanol-choline oxidoreductase [Streptomyces sp. AcH 505]|uniref:mycofactocin dehydrogenase MftG n=1 Tax=Streptomyces sp. AcH 505 TaxID=352211 RepID=UPI000591B087|nr:glucose-methanol-choline oxidoreductase [Streptomyces sp. AcH 505]